MCCIIDVYVNNAPFHRTPEGNAPMPYTHLRRSDLWITGIAAFLAAGLCIAPRFLLHADTGAYCEIISGGITEQYPLDSEQTLFLSHGGYTLTVTIGNGSVSVTEADCPDRVCVKTGEITRKGEVIVCIPAQIVIRIGGAIDGEADYIAG